ncbi:hypothetical protein PEC18_37910, partial [Paucibacter sp. O1-1]|nr:hypothetical protein [Paucibacter sp. O1-1]MDA3831404.1 hypothetical protein [Paucibacter sp. O1-1]
AWRWRWAMAPRRGAGRPRPSACAHAPGCNAIRPTRRFLAPWLLRLEQLSAEPGQASAMAPDSGVGLDGDAAMAPWLAAVGDGRP